MSWPLGFQCKLLPPRGPSPLGALPVAFAGGGLETVGSQETGGGSLAWPMWVGKDATSYSRHLDTAGFPTNPALHPMGESDQMLAFWIMHLPPLQHTHTKEGGEVNTHIPRNTPAACSGSRCPGMFEMQE